jgi:hypothetical protein
VIDRWYGVCCDGCSDGAEILGSPTKAWAAAERDGWTRESIPVSRNFRHYCPECTAKRAVSHPISTDTEGAN